MYQAPMFVNQQQQYMNQEAQVQQMPQAEVFDEAAFARAFEEAAQSELESELAQQQESESAAGVMINESAERFLNSGEPQLERIGADLIHDPLKDGENVVEQQNDPDALARTAAQLLDSVKDNQSDKFQNSTFLELMRQLRDKEVTVEGDKIVDLEPKQSAPGEVAAP